MSQFELQVRTLCGLPLAQPIQLAPCVMLNLMGELWLDADGKERAPDWASVLALPGLSLHLYGKAGARAGRKMGHITITGQSAEMAGSMAQEAAHMLGLHYAPTMFETA